MLSSHRMEQVEELTKDICIIDRSHAVVSGNLAQIKRSWPDRFIRMTALPDMSFIGAFPGVSVLPSADGYVNVKAPPNIAPADLLRAAIATGPVDHFEVVEPSLNDIYLHYVKPEESAA
jgi:ABC-2 type transport system ATP-binding protein